MVVAVVVGGEGGLPVAAAAESLSKRLRSFMVKFGEAGLETGREDTLSMVGEACARLAPAPCSIPSQEGGCGRLLSSRAG